MKVKEKVSNDGKASKPFLCSLPFRKLLARLCQFVNRDSKPFLKQIRLNPEDQEYAAVSRNSSTNSKLFTREQERYLQVLTQHCPSEVWPKECHLSGCPRPILLQQHHLDQLKDLHEALVIAVTDIVKRWWTAIDRNYPKRMPLKVEEEELLKWIDSQVEAGYMKDYAESRGSWRPDFMIEDHSASGEVETFRITEINARYAFNAFLIGYYGHRAFQSLDLSGYGLRSGVCPERVLKGICDLFDTSVPIFLLIGKVLEEDSLDIMMVPFTLQKYFGITAYIVSPSDLSLVQDASHPYGYRLFCNIPKIDSGLDRLEVHQVGLELRQHELMALESIMLQQISMRCFNDMRTVFLVHDKRMLGIVKEELGDLKDRGVITDRQRQILNRGIADSILAGSLGMRNALQESAIMPNLKDGYLLKPVRGGKGVGIVFGEDLTTEEWLSKLESLQDSELFDNAYVVQRRIRPRLYNVVLKKPDVETNPLIGSWQIINGQFTELSGWRSSSGRICAVSYGGAWIPSLIAIGE